MRHPMLFAIGMFAIAACGGPAKPVSVSSNPSGSCAAYLAAISDASIAIGDAGGRQQVYDAIVNSNLPYGPRLKSDLAKAQRELAAATEQAKVVGQPPASCGSLERATVTKPGIAAAQDQAIRAAYYRVGAIAGGQGEQELRTLADKDYAETRVAAQRAAYDALIKQLQSENP